MNGETQPTGVSRGDEIPYHSAYFGCCNRTVMTREDIAQPRFCPFCGKAIANGDSQSPSPATPELPPNSAAEQPQTSESPLMCYTIEQLGLMLESVRERTLEEAAQLVRKNCIHYGVL